MRTVTKRNLLKSFHILFSAIWLGSVFSMMVLSMVRQFDAEKTITVINLIKLIDIFVAISAFLTLVTGLLACKLVGWSFRTTWVKIKIIANIGIIMIGWLAIVEWHQIISILSLGPTTVFNTENYLYNVFHFNSVVVVLLIGIFFISVFKPSIKKTNQS